MEEKWYLKHDDVNRNLKVRNDLSDDYITGKFKNLLVIRHQFPLDEDSILPDSDRTDFFTRFEERHLEKLEDEGELILSAIDVANGQIRFLIYCDEPEQTFYDCSAFLKDSTLYKCEFDVVLGDNGKALKDL